MALTKIDDRGLKTPIDLLDNEKIRFGTSNDLEIYHSGNDNFITADTQNLILKTTAANKGTYLQSDDHVWITTPASAEVMAKFIKDGAVELYYNDSLRLSTTANGVTLGHNLLLDNATNAGRDITWDPANDQLQWKDNTKASFGDGSDLQIYHNGSHNYCDIANGQVLYFRHNSANKFYVQSGGAQFVGSLYGDDNNKIELGNGQDLKIYHTGSHAYMTNTTGNWYLQPKSGETAIEIIPDGKVSLRYDGGNKFETSSSGASVYGHLYVSDNLNLTNDNKKINLGDSSDLQIYHDGSHSRIKDAGTGYLIINTDTGVLIKNGADNENIAVFTPDGSCELNYNNSKRLETTNEGVNITGGMIVDAADTDYIVKDSTDSPANYIMRDYSAAKLYLGTSNAIITTRSNVLPDSDDTYDLGTSSARWEDAYLSGGLHLGGTGASNKINDYEEGNWSFNIYSGTVNNAGTTSGRVCKYIKVGKVVHFWFDYFQNNSNMQFVGTVVISGLPFTPVSDFHAHMNISTYNSGGSGTMVTNYMENTGRLVIHGNGTLSNIRHFWGHGSYPAA